MFIFFFPFRIPNSHWEKDRILSSVRRLIVFFPYRIQFQIKFVPPSSFRTKMIANYKSNSAPHSKEEKLIIITTHLVFWHIPCLFFFSLFRWLSEQSHFFPSCRHYVFYYKYNNEEVTLDLTNYLWGIWSTTERREIANWKSKLVVVISCPCSVSVNFYNRPSKQMLRIIFVIM